MDSLQGYFLIATPKMPDPRFQQQVVYICAHNEEGAMGLVVNQPAADLTLADVFANFAIAADWDRCPPVYVGGPVDIHSAFVLYSADFTASEYLPVTDTVHLCRDPEILAAIANHQGPRSFLFCLGYAGWAPGQLESELGSDGWLTLPADDSVLFDTPDAEKWHKAARLYGIDIAVYGDIVGTA